MVLFLEEPKQPTEVKTSSSETASTPSTITNTSPLADSINEFWKGSILEGKGQTLVDACSASTVPEMCAKVIAAQTKIETGFGSAGVGREHYKNLTGIRDSGKWRKYEKYDDSLKDTAKLFIEGNYQDYFTLYGTDKGLQKMLSRWGTNHYPQISSIVNSL